MFKSWKKDLLNCLQNQDSTYDQTIDEQIDTVIDPMLKFLHKSCNKMYETPDVALVQSLLRLWGILLKESESTGNLYISDAGQAKEIFGSTFLFAIIWSLCISSD